FRHRTDSTLLCQENITGTHTQDICPYNGYCVAARKEYNLCPYAQTPHIDSLYADTVHKARQQLASLGKQLYIRLCRRRCHPQNLMYTPAVHILKRVMNRAVGRVWGKRNRYPTCMVGGNLLLPQL